MSITAVLAPTNTGKTHRAVERMLEHETGMMGLPLRLLAREVYDRITALLGESKVALVTGEEKRVPANPRYWLCTVESMPVDRPVDFLAVDEIQMAQDPQRGHVFTARLLEARGRQETWFLGAETIRPALQKLVPEARIQCFPRFSQLRHTGAVSLRSLPPRSAVVAFSVTQVYELAERLRQRRGGVAVVLGALSPRARNAQVALYQSGEVQYMVATDAIGMGLNMDVDLIVFAALSKFDGRQSRSLHPAELAQIAGRAGRYRSDGAFGTLSSVPALRPSVVKAIENHEFQPVEQLIWRNTQLDLRAIDTLVASLSQRPTQPILRVVDYAEDYSALLQLAAQAEIRRRADGIEAVSLLWDVCKIPDFRQLLEGSHVRLLAEIYLQLSGPNGRIDRDWMNRRISRLDDVDGDIDTLMQRISFIRTWTYISNQPRWVDNAPHWRERTRDIEDRLSDALHERLVQRFVERRRQRQRPDAPRTDINNPFHKLRDLRLPDASGPDLQAAAWVQALIEASHDQFRVTADGSIHYQDRIIARITRGVDLLRPEVTLLLDDIGAGAQARIRRRLIAWTRDLVTESLAPLRQPQAQQLSPAGRGLVYQLEQRLGTIHRFQARHQIRALTPEDRQILRRLGVHLGGRLVYVPSLLSPAALRRRVVLNTAQLPPASRLAVPPQGAASVDARPDLDESVYISIGYPVFGPRAIRADLAERAHQALFEAAKQGPFAPPAQLTSWLGCRNRVLPEIIAAFGYRPLPDGRLAPRRRRRPRRRPPRLRQGRE